MFSKPAHFLTTLVFVINAVFAHAVESNFWSQRREAVKRAGQLSSSSERDLAYSVIPEINRGLPNVVRNDGSRSALALGGGGFPTPDWLSGALAHGDVTDRSISSDGDAPLVVHIQDAHGITEAQHNISSLVGALQAGHGINVMGVEGSEGAVDLSAYRAFPATLVKDVADFFLERGLIAGSEYAGLTLPRPPEIVGLEQGSLYADNLSALRQSYAAGDRALAALAHLREAARLLKEKCYSRELRDFDDHGEAYRSSRESLGDFVRYLIRVIETRPGPTAFSGKSDPLREGDQAPPGPNIMLLADALALEKSINFDRVESERRRLVETLVKRASTRDLSRLAEKSVGYRAGTMGYGDFHAQLMDLCRDNGVNLKDHAALSKYLRYVTVAEKIDTSSLITEMEALESYAQDALAVTDDQRRLVADGRLLNLLEKLLRHEMTPQDWRRYRGQTSDMAGLPSRLLRPDLPLPDTAPYELFCSKAIDRNRALVDNLMKKMAEDKVRTAILVAGGFHSEGITRLLKDNNINYIVLTPKIKNVPKDSRYLDVLARDPVPMEKILAGKKIFLSPWLALGKPGPSSGVTTPFPWVRQVFLNIEELLAGEIQEFTAGGMRFKLAQKSDDGVKVGRQTIEVSRTKEDRAGTLAHYALESLFQAIPAALSALVLTASGPLLSVFVFVLTAHVFSRSFAQFHGEDGSDTVEPYRLSFIASAILYACCYVSLATFLSASLSLAVGHKFWAKAIEISRDRVRGGSGGPVTTWVAAHVMPTFPVEDVLRRIFDVVRWLVTGEDHPELADTPRHSHKRRRVQQDEFPKKFAGVINRMKGQGRGSHYAQAYFSQIGGNRVHIKSDVAAARFLLNAVEQFDYGTFMGFKRSYVDGIRKLPLEQRRRQYYLDLMHAGQKMGHVLKDEGSWILGENPDPTRYCLSSEHGFVEYLGDLSVERATIPTQGGDGSSRDPIQAWFETRYPGSDSQEEFVRAITRLYFVTSRTMVPSIPGNPRNKRWISGMKEKAKAHLGAAVRTRSLLRQMGLPDGAGFIGFVEGVAMGIMSITMGAVPLFLMLGATRFVGVDMSTIPGHHAMEAAGLFVTTALGGIFLSKKAVFSALSVLHRKGGALLPGGSVSLERKDIDAAVAIAMSGFLTTVHAAPLLTAIVLMAPGGTNIAGLALVVISILAGFNHALINLNHERKAFEARYRTNKGPVDKALRTFLGDQILNSWSAGRVIPRRLNAVNVHGIASVDQRIETAGVGGVYNIVGALVPLGGENGQPTVHTYDVTPLIDADVPSSDKILLAAALCFDLARYGMEPAHRFVFISTDEGATRETVLTALGALPGTTEKIMSVFNREIRTVALPQKGESKVKLLTVLKSFGIDKDVAGSAVHRIVAPRGAVDTEGISRVNIVFVDLKRDLTRTLIKALEAMRALANDA